MIDLSTIIGLFGDTFLDGQTVIAGAIVLVIVLALVMAISKKVLVTLVIALPLIMIWSVLGFLPSEIGIMMLVVVALGIGLEAKGVFS